MKRALHFHVKDVVAVVQNTLRLARNSQVQIRPTKVSQTDTVSPSRDSYSNEMITTYAISIYNFLKLISYGLWTCLSLLPRKVRGGLTILCEFASKVYQGKAVKSESKRHCRVSGKSGIVNHL